MPWYLALLMPIVEKFGAIALQYGLSYLESKYPNSKPIIDLIIAWLKQQAGQGNVNAVEQLSAHVNNLCSGAACPADLAMEEK